MKKETKNITHHNANDAIINCKILFDLQMNRKKKNGENCVN